MRSQRSRLLNVATSRASSALEDNSCVEGANAAFSQRLLAEMRQKPVVLGVLLVAITLLLYAPVIHHAFLEYDDGAYVTKKTRSPVSGFLFRLIRQY